jgi:chromosome segregation ATPase
MNKLGSREGLQDKANELATRKSVVEGKIKATKEALEKEKTAIPDAQKRLAEIEQSGRYKRPKASKEWKEAAAPIKKVGELNKALEEQEKAYSNIEEKQKSVNGQMEEYEDLTSQL